MMACCERGITLAAPAKLNLFLEVLRKRADGYHEIETLMVTLGLYDTLQATPRENGDIAVTCTWTQGRLGFSAAETKLGRDVGLGVLPPPAENLATRAVLKLRERAGLVLGLNLHIAKRIPAVAGLGGASSDAAAALVAANHVWDLGWSKSALAEVAAEIGSDVPFFLTGGAAICRGRGEQIETVQPAVPFHVVLVRPPAGLATADVYRQCRVASEPRTCRTLAQALGRSPSPDWSRWMHNRLQPAAARLCPWIDRLAAEFDRQPVVAHQMSGSGTTYFGICGSAREAKLTAARLRSRGLGSVWHAATLTRPHRN